MRLLRIVKGLLLIVIVFLSGAPACSAFSLLGPYTKWMSFTNHYRLPGDIGGPMGIGQGYRWNVPIVTYAFDKSFMDFFGSNGVAAVEQAIAILNRVPPASHIVLTNYPTYALRENYTAESQALYDLKSAALSLLLEHMGLAEPTRNVFTLRRWDPILQSGDYYFQGQWPSWFIPNYVIRRNFDPKTLQESQYVNGVLTSGYILFETNLVSGSLVQADVTEYPIDGTDYRFAGGVADKYTLLNPGFLYTGLTSDDVGGLRYLLSTNTVSYERLLPDVRAPSPTAPSVVNGALRPGVEKVSFVRHPYTPLNRPSTMSYQYTDTYVVNGVRYHQLLERSVGEPDFLFTAANLTAGVDAGAGYSRTDTSKWWNSMAGTTNVNRGGPGVIRPPAKITFHKRGVWVDTSDDYLQTSPLDWRWGSFGTGANLPITYRSRLPLGTRSQLLINLHLDPNPLGVAKTFTWQLPVRIGSNALLQTSINLQNWQLVTAVANDGTLVDWYHLMNGSQRFFRVVPE
jgi:hypothetical protein